MNGAHIHLLLNHIPVLGALFGLLLLLAALVRRNHPLLRVAYVVFIVSAIVAAPAFFTGEGAEDAVEGQPGVTEAVIDRHEDASKVALAAAIGLGLLSIGAVVQSVRSERTSPALGIVILLVSVATTGLMAWTANLGGEIRHTEIRSGAVSMAGEQQGGDEQGAAEGEDD